MAGEWRTVRLEEIAATDRKGFAMGPFGSNIKSENYKATGIPVLRGVNLGESGFLSNDLVYLSEEKAEELKNSQAFPGDLVFVAQGTVGKVGLVPNQRQFQKTVLSQNLMKFSCDGAKADPRFFYYFFVSSEGQHTIMSRVNPTGVPCISRPLSSLKDFVVPFPPLAEQRAIASVLGALDDKIELNHRTNETLEALAQSLFKSWFLDAAERELPDGWKEGVVGDDFDITMGQSPPGETYNQSGEGLPFFQGRADFGVRFPELRVYCTAPTRIANPGDSLVCVRAPVGDINMAAQRCCVGRGLAAVRHKTGSRSYTYYAMRALRENFDRFEAEGTVFGSMNKKDFHAIAHVVPPEQKVKDFERLAHPLDERIQNNVEESRTLATLRNALLPKLLSGEVRVG